jgi:inner membrane transporter RhtA
MDPMRTSRTPAPLLMLAAVISVQFGAALARTQFEQVGPTGAALLRLVFGALILFAVIRPRLRRWTAVQWRAAALLGVALAGMNMLIYAALDRIPLGVAVTLEFTGPLVLALVQTRRVVDAVWALLAFAGVALLGLESAEGLELAGVAFALGAAVFWVGYIVGTARVGRLLPGVEGLPVAMAVGSLIALPFGAGDAVAGAVQSPVVLPVFLGVALLSSALPYALEMLALQRLSTRVFGVLSALGPAVAALAGFLILGETLGLREISALLFVSLASVGVTLGGRGNGSGRNRSRLPDPSEVPPAQ